MHLLCWQSKAGIWSCGWCISCWLSGLPLFVPEIVQQSSLKARLRLFRAQQITNSWKPWHGSLLFVFSVLSSWECCELFCLVICQTLEISQVSALTGRFSRKRTCSLRNHAFLHVNTPGLRGARLLKLFVEWQLLSYRIICKNSFDRFNKWTVYDVLLKS